MKTAMITAVRK